MGAFPLNSIAILGGGVGGWLAAAVLARVLGGSCAVRVLELPGTGTGAIATVPSLHRFLRMLGLDESALMRATQATYRLGTEFRDWGARGERYFQGFGSIGVRLGAVPFQHHWLRLAAHGECAPYEDFSVAAQIARQLRFAPPQADPRSVLSQYTYAWHFDAGLLAGRLREHARAAGVIALSGDVVSIERADDGGIRALVLTGGARLTDDFYIDCSGAPALLSTALGVDREDWSAWMPCDRMMSVRDAPIESLPPFSQITAEPYGWRSLIPLQHSSERSLAYSSEALDDDAAAASLGGAAPRRCELLRGRPREFWVGNVLLLPGDTLDPLQSAGLHLTGTGIMRFLAHFPVRRVSAPDAAEYNRLTGEEYDRLRDLLIAHYHLTRRDDSALWRRCRAMSVPDALAQRLALFADSGRMTVGEDEHCGLDGWLSVLLGQGARPRSYDPLADVPPLAAVRGALDAFAAEVRTRSAAIPRHLDYVAQRVPAPRPGNGA